ncbi:MAG: ribonuclease Y [Armatimonadetes bacterium]|nr:ribonuclease Y [Armatimonadota bacterium]
MAVVAFVLGAVISALVSSFISRQSARRIQEMREEARKLQDEARTLIELAKKDAETIKKESRIEAKEEAHRIKIEGEKELQRWERRISQKEENLDRKREALERKEAGLGSKEQELSRIKEQLGQLEAQQRQELERVSRLSQEEAKELLLRDVEREIQLEVAARIKRGEEQVKEESEKRARHIITTAIQRYAGDHTAESTVSVVPLPSDEMKGRIIGREGRNIRMLETLTGIDLIIDDTPEAVVISGFNPIRREIARMALEKLILDGRIHPARIEEMVEKAQKEMEVRVKEAGERACFEVGITGVHPELVKTLGRLLYRTSYAQNVLQHSIEVALISGAMASELHGDPAMLKRAGLLHDIGKAVDSEVEGPHAQIGAKLAQKYGEPAEIVRAIAGHHGEEEPQTMEAVLVCAADAISAARPGARMESLDNYIKRLDRLEKVANSFNGVEKSYAIQAGREIRIIVKPEAIDDLAAQRLARDIVSRIETELEYPGQIKVTVVRETRAVEYAK